MANTKITSKVIADANILTAAIADNAVTGDKVADDVALAGNPTTTTQTAGNSTTRLATTAFVSTAISNLVDSSPAALNTLNELAAALGDDANFSTTVTNSIATKLPLAGGTMTGNIAHASDFTLDVGGTILLDAGDGIFKLRDDGSDKGRITVTSDIISIVNSTQDGDIKFDGLDGSSSITALRLDMSDAGKATFNSGANFSGNVDISVGSNLNSEIKQLSFDNFPNEGIGITFSRTSSDADLMAIGVADTSKLNIASRSGLIFSTGGGTTYSATSESMRIDSSGNVLVGTTDAQIYDHTSGEGIVFRNGEAIDVARSGDSQMTLNRMTDEGANISLHQAGTLRATIGTKGSGGFYIGTGGDNERLRIDSVGRETNSFQPYTAAYDNSGQTVSAVTWTDVAYDTTLENNGTDMRSGTTFTFPVAGVYIVTGCLSIDSVNATNYAQVRAVFGSHSQVFLGLFEKVSDNVYGYDVPINFMVKVSASDTMKIQAFSGSGSMALRGGAASSHIEVMLMR